MQLSKSVGGRMGSFRTGIFPVRSIKIRTDESGLYRTVTRESVKAISSDRTLFT